MRASRDEGGQPRVPGRTSSGVFPSRRLTTPRGKAWWVPLALAVPVLGLLVGQAVLLSRRFGESPALAPVDVTVTPSGGMLVSGATVELAAFGDSAMAGVGVHHADDSLPVQLAQRVADATGRPVHVVGHAVSGARTIDVLTQQLPRVRRTPDVSVLVVGTNDVTGVTPAAALARSLRALLDGLVALDAPVVMSSLPEFRAMRLVPHPLLEAVLGYAAVVSSVQRHEAARQPHVRYIDVRAAVGPEFINDTGTMSADLFHPSAAGYGQIADVLLAGLLSVLGTARSSETT
jgi:lysophospholipase L1-like esterase